MKEYGEGIDRMCRELEAIGLLNPVFNNSTFILKTAVMSADRAQRAPGNAMIDPDNAMIDHQNAMIGPENAMIDKSNSWDHTKNLPI